MSSLSVAQKTYLEAILDMSGGYVLDFSDASFAEHLASAGIDINAARYTAEGPSKARRLRALWQVGSDTEVSATLRVLAEYMEAKNLIGSWNANVSDEQITKVRQIADSLATEGGNASTSTQASAVAITTEATVTDNRVSIEIHEDIHTHIKPYLAVGHYFHAVEEAYKVVREKLRQLTGFEGADKVFSQNAQSDKYLRVLFGKDEPSSDVERDFFRGVGYLHLGVQFLRNEKVHTPATDVEPNLAVHYISLASLAYDLITRYISDETVAEIEALVQRTRSGYNARRFYEVFDGGKWMETIELPSSMRSTAVRRALRDKWLREVDFTRSYDNSNVMLMRFELIVDVLTVDDIDDLLSRPTKDVYSNDQMAGLEQFLEFVEQRDPAKLSPKARETLARLRAQSQ
ncbi:TIGR02391 family protein [Isoptericola haloaureus]|uniref:TIGR02391 family protein n=1 Tax=Isoptericola haloaureus TaxID=1542902 RepID=A0ABU7Z5A1_9MICO